MMKAIFSTFLVALLLYTGTAQAATDTNDSTPCPVISGVQTTETIQGGKCNFPSGSFPIGSPAANDANTQLVAWNTQHRSTSQNGVSDGSSGNNSGSPVGHNGQGDSGVPAPNTSGQSCDQRYPSTADLINPGYYLCKISEIFQDIFSAKNLWWVLGFGSWVFFRLAQVFIGYATWWLDGSVYFLVLHMGAFIGSPQADGIRIAWAAIRDLANIAIIAGFVAVGISTILDISQYAADKFLSRLIIAALFINFSYFFAGAIIDGANYVAIQVYNSGFMTDGCGETTKVVGGWSYLSAAGAAVNPFGNAGDGQAAICSISKSFMKKVKLDSWDNLECMARARAGAGACTFDAQGNVTSTPTGGSSMTDTSNLNAQQTGDLYFELFIIALLGGAFLFGTAFVFMSAAYLLVGRFAVLIILLITSPIGIAGINVPYLERYAQRWWDMLLSQAFFAPVFFVLVAISFKVIDGLVKALLNGKASYADSVGGSSAVNGSYIEGDLALFITFFVGIAFMFISLQAARAMAESAPEFKMIYDDMKKRAGQTFWAPARSAKLFGTIPAWGIQAGADRMAARYGANTYRGMLFTGLGAGARAFTKLGTKGKDGDKSSWELAQEAAGERRKNRYRGDPRKILGGVMQQGALSTQWTGTINKGKYDPNDPNNPKNRTAKEEEELDHLIHSMKGQELLDELGPDGVKKIADKLSEEQRDEILGSDSISHDQKSNITNAIFEGFTKAFKSGDHDTARDILKGMSETEKNLLLAERKELAKDEKFLALLDSKSFESMQNNRKIYGTAEEARTAGDLRMAGFEKVLSEMSDPRHVKDLISKNMTGGELNKLKLETFTSAKVMSNLKLTQIQERYDITKDPEEQQKILAAAKEHGGWQADQVLPAGRRASPRGQTKPPDENTAKIEE